MPDHTDVPYLQAEHYLAGRPDGPPIWIVWHTMEEDELPDRAEAVAQFFARNTGPRTVSAHYCFDSDSEVQCVHLRDVAFTVGNRPGNNRGINVELAGRAAQRADQWRDSFSQAMLRGATRIVKRDMARYGIPNRWCSVADLHARRAGHTTHNDLRIAFGGTTHTDPGPNFPRQQVVDLINEWEDDDMTEPELHAALDRYFRDRLNPGKGGKVHWLAAWLRVLPWHQRLGRTDRNMHAVMGELLAGVTALPDLIAESADEIGLPPEQAQALADAIAARVQRVTVIVDDDPVKPGDGEAPPEPS